ncbi:flagellar biosynthesis regulator FlhF [Zhengella mangrovi]|uniref:Flagellar biosynthesis regulator FlhF n=1 Tax=Zhengella mangrovi TaxID=1982044 RepID=A0A2G1QJL1_9HYPH|nr:flagellar biosynthesis regulator FlaF [Zhengella mangrovi]PHP65706.1 flagellar biosynthesis regulator FlhF [Zhengella mangrovi]
MYIHKYEEIQTDDLEEARAREREAFDQSIDMLQAAKAAGAKSIEAIHALHFTAKVWMALMTDLADPENALPKEVRASLLSIGIWMLRTVDEIRQERSENFDGLIDISKIIRDGIR